MGRRQDQLKTESGDYITRGIVLIAVGALLFIFQLISGLQSLNKNMVRFKGPGPATVKISSAGEQEIFLESEFGSRESVRPSSIKIEIRDPSGNPVRATAAKGRSTYSDGRVKGVSVASFTADAPGAYTISARNEETGPDEISLAMGKPVSGEILTIILNSVLILFISEGVGIVLIITGIRKRQALEMISGIADNEDMKSSL